MGTNQVINPELAVFSAIARWLAVGESVWLSTVVETYGSSPRPVGSVMACAGNGETVGSLSGGCVEEDLVESLLAEPAVWQTFPQQMVYGLNAEDNERLGLPCGGKLGIVVERLTATDNPHVAGIVAALEKRECITRNVDFATKRIQLQTSATFKALEFNATGLSHTLGPEYRLLLIGAGQLAQTLAQMALAFGYSVLVCDPRPELVDAWPVAGVDAVQAMPDDLIRAEVKDAHTIVLALTHDPRIDDMGLMEALLSPAFYVGALGSVRTAEKRVKRLQALDIPAAAIARLHAPVGLAIGAKTPAEISVAILAELTQLRRKTV